MTEEGITLTELLDSRDRRRARQQEWLAAMPEAALLVLTVVMPGSVKRSSLSLDIARAAVEEIRTRLADRMLRFETFDLPTGFEAFAAIDASPDHVKQAACSIEDCHPLGRLFDIDVFAADGTPLTRTQYGLPARRCIICGDDARVCMRTRRHDYDELLNTIQLKVNDFYGR